MNGAKGNDYSTYVTGFPPKKEQRRLFFFYSEAGILHGKSRAVALQGRTGGGKSGFSRRFFVAENPNYN